jgi:hypothetical protein
VNARLLYRVEFALPRELPAHLQVRLAERFLDWTARLCGRDVERAAAPLSYAIHAGFGRNPHVHCLVSTSLNDGHARSADAWFRRAQASNPARGGAPRSRFMGQRRWLMLIREGWAAMANIFLAKANLPQRLDHRSHRARGLPFKPTRHEGPGRSPVDSGAHLWRKFRRVVMQRIDEHHDAWRQRLARQARHEEEQQLQDERIRARYVQQLRELQLLVVDRVHELLHSEVPEYSALVVSADPDGRARNAELIDSPGFADWVDAAAGPDWFLVRIADSAGLVNVRTGALIHVTASTALTDGRTQASMELFAQLAAGLHDGPSRCFVQQRWLSTTSSTAPGLTWNLLKTVNRSASPSLRSGKRGT